MIVTKDDSEYRISGETLAGLRDYITDVITDTVDEKIVSQGLYWFESLGIILRDDKFYRCTVVKEVNEGDVQ